jgi:SAM-dependent methyltransferase
MQQFSNSDEMQKRLYNSIASQYALHYGDRWSQDFRRRFVNEPMLGGVELSGKEVLDAMCGSGETTEYLLSRGARVTGLDISEQEIHRFQECFPTCKACCQSILSTGFEGNSFDCVVVMGGLHHVHPNCSRAISEIHRVLKPGGLFCFHEPHAGSFPDMARKLWYKHDRKRFAENEAAIDLDALKQEFSTRFAFEKEEYGGNVAYLLVMNSLMLRIPHWMKRYYSSALMPLESAIRRIQGKRLSCIVICRWRKLTTPT